MKLFENKCWIKPTLSLLWPESGNLIRASNVIGIATTNPTLGHPIKNNWLNSELVHLLFFYNMILYKRSISKSIYSEKLYTLIFIECPFRVNLRRDMPVCIPPFNFWCRRWNARIEQRTNMEYIIVKTYLIVRHHHIKQNGF